MNKEELIISVNGKDFDSFESYKHYMNGQYYFDKKEILNEKYKNLINGISKIYNSLDIMTTDLDMRIHLGVDGYAITYNENCNIPFKEEILGE